MAAPERLGKYLIRRELGRGAMGVVYEGYDPMIERAVAIKVLRLDESNPTMAQELRTRFRREAQAAGRLGHPGIVAVYEYGEDAATESTFIAMELVRGADLKSLFDAGKRFTLEETGRLMETLLVALQHAHERGVVHRDIKPGNIILLDSGGVKIADFGIAKLDTSELTQLGSVLGTVSHMSPEQLTGDPVDGRSDLYSCGVILYQLLTGERPFTGTPAALMHKVLHEVPPPPSLRRPRLTRALDEVVLTAMAKKPAERHRDANAFGAALRAALAQVADDEATVVMPAAATSDPASRTVLPGTWVPGTSPGVVPSQAPQSRGVSSEGVSRPGALAAGSSTTLRPGTSVSGPAASRTAGSRRWVAAALGVATLLAAGAVAYRMLGPRVAGEPTVLARAPAPSVASNPSSEGGAASATATPPSAASAASDAAAQVPTAASAASATEATLARAAAVSTPPAATRASAPSALAAASTARVRPTTPAPAPASRPSLAAAPAAPPPTGAAAMPVPPPATNPGARPSTRSADSTFSPADMRAPGEVRPAPEPRDSRVARAEPRPAALPPATPASGQGPARTASRPEPGSATRPATAPASPSSSAGTAGTDTDCIEEARRGNARCQLVLAGLYRSGRGVPRDMTEAARWYRKAAEQGSDVGQYELGLLYENGIGVAKDPVAAMSWYRKAAAQGNSRAQNRMGVTYEDGIAGPVNLVLAADWYRRAADQELPIAEYNLGRLYLSGRGVFQDAAKGRALLQKAADRGEPNAMVHLGAMYAKGEGKPRDREQSLQLYRDALARPGLTDRNRDLATRALAAAR